MAHRTFSLANHHPRLRFDRREVLRALRWLEAHAAEVRVPQPAFLEGELSLVFLTDVALAQLHASFLDDPTITDVITFEGNPSLGTAGEVCVSADAALRQIGIDPARGTKSRAARRLSVAQQRLFSAEVTLYLVHGWLHLAGYDDLQPMKKRAMRRAEARAMRILRTGPAGIPQFTLA
ncbi:rRNA maturation RNase YbeY [Opitutus terrae]|uniref:Endoribonuclease YbeY n=1 Tax=Opitutus terrae (strain DSM 11246 / JCM 15787 / PB90-1) TaxID=452637 RepID=B1ZT12_OPITP|nr:rRNA maturation RNase YbeY [Opitutus terrae]ACB75801.1 protein of unknown function UPF0054 [Opitutus terrae PB90-1]